VLRRKHQIEELRREAGVSDSALAEAKNQLELAEQKLEATQAAIYTIQNETQTLEIEAAALKRDIHQTERAQQEALALEQRLQREFEQISSDAERALTEKQTIDSELEELRNQQTDLESSTLQAQSSLSEKDAALKAQEETLQQIKIQQASLQERAQSLKREYDAAKSLIQDRSRRLQEILRTLDRASHEKEQFAGDEGQLAEKIESLTLNLHSAREKLSEIKDRIEQSNARVDEAMEKIKNLHKSGDQKTTESTQVALEIEKLSGEISHLTLNLEEKYGAGCLDQATSEPEQQELGSVITPTVEISAEEEHALGEEVEKLRERIRRLGEVNVMAIEEFEILKKRHDHLLTEKSDLVKSLENLQQAIEHINTTSEERFRKAFEAIADRFTRLFPIIFGGGQAKLSLTYPEGSTDILEAGVDILAQPPGKKIVNITLLSGGEKALTAVSLIFAIFMVKPSPFCVLDEVDAPLDDANIGKFNALLREMSARSQFILITHNKKTMELNDTLYGVTMEEPGVSKMVSIEMH
ncbi:MAG: hypothetical protein HYX41_07550, partial [Bdellovibrio sp.]|nr:hypothetical protein [Bdellovibrio sp.]